MIVITFRAIDISFSLKKEKRVQRVLISSFNPLILWYVKWIDKNVRTGFLYDNPKLLFLKNIILRALLDCFLAGPNQGAVHHLGQSSVQSKIGC